MSDMGYIVVTAGEAYLIKTLGTFTIRTKKPFEEGSVIYVKEPCVEMFPGRFFYPADGDVGSGKHIPAVNMPDKAKRLFMWVRKAKKDEYGFWETTFERIPMEAVRKNGKDIDISEISSCEVSSLDLCEDCPKYASCQSVAYANDILKAAEETGL